MRNFVAALALLCIGSSVSAQPCTGASSFSDVPSTAGYCSNVEWLLNRSITLGCQASLYCPGDPVTRAQMALFMNRLGVALTPSTAIFHENTPAVDLSSTSYHCITPSYVITDYPRTLVLVAHFSGQTDGTLAYQININSNTTGSTTFFPNFLNPILHRGAATGVSWAHASTSATIDLDVGSTYRFAIAISRSSTIGGTGDLTDGRCTLLATLQPRERNSILP